jgi:hypothetical protein
MISKMMMNRARPALTSHPPAKLPRRKMTKEGAGKKTRASKNKKTKPKEGAANKNKDSPLPTSLLSNDGAGRRILKTDLNNIINHPKGVCGALGFVNRSTFFRDFVDNQSKRVATARGNFAEVEELKTKKAK